jgi:hypothetical protein
MADWHTVQQDVYPAYLSWAEFLSNQERLQQNASLFDWNKGKAQGISRSGAALLQGMLICAVCGHHLRVGYKPAPYYECIAKLKRLQGPRCT